MTIDAMGRHAEVAGAIVEGGDDILAVRGDESTLHEAVVGHVLERMEDDFGRVAASRHESKKAHRREEHRMYDVLNVPAGLPDARRWRGLKRIGVAIGQAVRGGKACDDVRDFL